MPTISVIVPIYNAATYLERCINSLIHQSYYDLQIILIDDGSTDNSYQIAQNFATKDKRIKLISQSNQGQSAARNKGLQYALGEYISFIDADDYIDLDFYQTLISTIGTKDCVQIGYKRVSISGNILQEKAPVHFYQFTSPCMRLYRHDTLEKYHILFPTDMIYEDVIFSLEFWKHKPTYNVLAYKGYNYMVNPLSTTAKRDFGAEKKLFATIKKLKHQQPLWYKLLIIYTSIRLKFHFSRYE